MNGRYKTTRRKRFQSDAPACSDDDWLAVEEPLEIRIRGDSVSVTMRTPGNDSELIAGFLVSEGVIRRRADLIDILPCPAADSDSSANIFNVFLDPSVAFDPSGLRRNLYSNSSCGICGKASIEAVHNRFAPVTARPTISAKTLLRLPERLAPAQEVFRKTGGLHAAGIFTLAGELVVLREDIGRHNALDKAIGAGLLGETLPFDQHALLVSGRASFEILHKALSARIPIVAAVSAPSSLAVEFAEQSGQTLVGFLRRDGFNLYAHADRVEM